MTSTDRTHDLPIGEGSLDELDEQSEFERAPDDERAAVLSLLKASNIGASTVRSIIEAFGSARAALTANDSTLSSVGKLKEDAIRSLREAVGDGFGEKQLEMAERLGARVLLMTDPEYPPLLKTIHNPPVSLFVQGNVLPSDNRAVAIVGSRAATEPGVEIAHQLGAGLDKAGVCTVSGMALGIDGAAHRGSLQESGNTVAILGCGIDVLYPKAHRKLRDELLQSGTLVSELFLGAGPEQKHFPMRNRIIAGMSMGTVVVEASRRSGSLITANYAMQENRSVFAVPGHPLAKSHEGCNYLLRQGVIPVRHAGDLLEDLAPQLGLTLGGQQGFPLDMEPEELTDDEQRVYDKLDTVDSIHADKLADQLKMDASRLGAILMMLEMKGVAQRLPGDRYRKRAYQQG
ncbi:DNA-processing protein DprA [bacterium]|nr:DNA-processing protein DprA [bacterium]